MSQSRTLYEAADNLDVALRDLGKALAASPIGVAFTRFVTRLAAVLP